MSEQFRLRGVIAAPFTPMNEDGNIDFPIVKEYASRLKMAGVRGVFIGGTTGESLSMTTTERTRLAETWIEEQEPGFPVFVHSGCESLPDSLYLACHAKEIGAAGIGTMPPVFFKPAFSELIAFCKATAKACFPLPFFYYHIPSMTCVNHSMLELAKVCSNEIPNFHGIKYTHNNLMEYSLLCEYNNQNLDILFGVDEMLLSGLTLGAKGMIGSTYNYAMAIYNPLLEAYKQEDIKTALQWQIKSQKVIQVLIAHGGGTVAGKAFMKIAGLDLGPCRLPNKKVETEEIASIRSELIRKGVLELVRV